MSQNENNHQETKTLCGPVCALRTVLLWVCRNVKCIVVVVTVAVFTIYKQSSRPGDLIWTMFT